MGFWDESSEVECRVVKRHGKFFQSFEGKLELVLDDLENRSGQFNF